MSVALMREPVATLVGAGSLIWPGRAIGGRPPLRYRIGCLPLPNHYACGWLVGRLGQRNRRIVGIAGERQKAEGRMKKKARGTEKSEAKGQSSTGPRGSEGAQNM